MNNQATSTDRQTCDNSSNLPQERLGIDKVKNTLGDVEICLANFVTNVEHLNLGSNTDNNSTKTCKLIDQPVTNLTSWLFPQQGC